MLHSKRLTIASGLGVRSSQRRTIARKLLSGRFLPRVLTNLCRLTLLIALQVRGANGAESHRNSEPDIAYNNYRNPQGPVSIHVVRVPRGKSPFQIQSVHAEGKAVGLGQLSEQVKLLNSALAFPVAGLNGDFYERGGTFAGDPRGLQIVAGELISAPSGTASFWIDAVGEPHITNTMSQFQVTWPDGKTAPIGLNGNRRSNGIELYTSALGFSTRTYAGRELVLEQRGNSPWLPLRPTRTYQARVREVRETGNTRILPDTMVLSIGPSLARLMPAVQPGAELTISTMTLPDLRGAKTAISGGVVLLREGKRQRTKGFDNDSYEFSSMAERHPRSAIGWNDDYFFLVEVDGRRRNLSVGMTLDQLSSYLADLGCREAMNLDGGGSATLWYNGRVQNQPCDGYERPIANSLIVVKKKDSQTPVKGASIEEHH